MVFGTDQFRIVYTSPYRIKDPVWNVPRHMQRASRIFLLKAPIIAIDGASQTYLFPWSNLFYLIKKKPQIFFLWS